MPPPAKPTFLDHLGADLQRILPQHLLAAGMYRLARSTRPWLKNAVIGLVRRRYRIAMAEAEQPDPRAYASFNAFFTRALKPGTRPVAPDRVVCPADGRISQATAIRGETLLQAKGREYSMLSLLAGDRVKTHAFNGGLFATVYLSPSDYHRVHMPFAGTLESMVFVPGELFSVSEVTTQLVPDLFARNERVICHFDTEIGPMAVILVGAIFVGSIETVWHGEVRGPRGQPTKWAYHGEQRRRFEAGDEIGRFNMGSTVIVLLPPGSVSLESSLLPGAVVRMGQSIARPAGPGVVPGP